MIFSGGGAGRWAQACAVAGLALLGALLPITAGLPARADAPFPAHFKPISPTRVLDTRNGTGGYTNPLSAGQSISLPLAGHGPVPSGASAVILNVTVVNTSTWSYLTVYPTGPRPEASNLNFGPSSVLANLATVNLGSDGAVSFFNANGGTDVIADLEGYYQAPVNDSSGLFRPLPPTRIVDTRTGEGGRQAALGPGQPVTFQVTGRGGVPSSGVSAVALNLTAIFCSETTYLSVYPADLLAPPNSSTVNCMARLVVPNRAIVRLSPDGKVTVYNSRGSVDVAIDTSGWFTNGADAGATGGAFTGTAPTRLLDTRTGNGAPAEQLGPGFGLGVQVAGRGGVPPSGAGSAVLNVTATDVSAASLLSVYPGASWLPLASDLNFFPGQTIANLVVAKLGSDGTLVVHNDNGLVDVVADLAGWYSDGPSQGTPPGAPALTAANAISRSQVTVTWNPPSDSSGRRLVSYTVIMQPGLRQWAVDASAASFTVSGLACNRPYTFLVAASNEGGGSGPASTASSPVTPPCPTSNVIQGVPWIHQIYALSCEEASLQMLLAYEGINVSQGQILNDIGVDYRHGYYDGNGLRWGNPYTSFVGNPNGSEADLSGYGTYWTTIARVGAQYGGRVLRAGEGIPPQDLYQAILDDHPVEVWVTWDWAYHSRRDYLTFDGQWVLYAGPIEHAITLVGVSPDSVLVNDPDRSPYWLPRSTFEASYATYNNMAVIFG